MKNLIVIFCAVGILLAGLFPPWLYTYQRTGMIASEKSAGYRFLFDAPQPLVEGLLHGVKIDVNRLAVTWVCISVAGAALWFAANRKPNLN